MPLRELLKNKDKTEFASDYHILRFYAAFIAVSKGKVVDIKGPFLEFCPLVKMLYGNINYSNDMKPIIKEAVEKKIHDFGFFTLYRDFSYSKIAVPFGASEMLMYALRKKTIDSAVIVCDGAGSVIVTDADIVQGIAARMNGLFYTTPIPEIIEKLEQKKCNVVFSDARINQIEAVQKACELGYKNIVVTINGFLEEENLFQIKLLEYRYSVSITMLIICTTGASIERVQEIAKYADVVWSCASTEVRNIVGKKSILQISRKIPVFVLTTKGLNFVSAYSEDEAALKNLDLQKQYIFSQVRNDTKIILGDNFVYYLSESMLPSRSNYEPRYLKKRKTHLT